MKTIVAALAGASLLALAVPAVAESPHSGGGSGGWSHGGGSGGMHGGGMAGAPGGGWSHGGNWSRGGFAHSGAPSGFAGRSGFSGHPGFNHFHGFHGRPYPFYGASFGLGLVAGLSFYDPWYYGFYD
ncbi:MAG: hypothetical protein JSS35_08200, partial [Proteobacteria bacterium]|nr:hypothetical protein [Pseudomonadota bacterium]